MLDWGLGIGELGIYGGTMLEKSSFINMLDHFRPSIELKSAKLTELVGTNEQNSQLSF